MILWLIIVIFGLWIVKFRIKKRRMYGLASLLPKPKEELPLIGIAHKFAGNMEDVMRSLTKLSYESMQHNGIMRAWFGNNLYIALTNPVDMEMVLRTCLEKDDLYQLLRPVVGNGILIAPVHIWRRRRKLMAPAFSPKNLESFVTLLAHQSEKLAKVLEPKANKETFAMWPFLCSFTLDAVLESSIGTKINTLDSENSLILKSINRIFELATERAFHLWLWPDWLYKLFPQYREFKECYNIVTSFADQVIEKKRIELIRNKEKSDYETNLDNDIKSFLDSLILTSDDKNEYSNLELREEIMVLICAGMDTSATTIGNVLKVLAKYPDVQEKLYEELHQVFGDSGRLLVTKDLIKLQYMEQVVKETLRLIPSAPVVARKILEDITLPSGRVLPADSSVVCSILGVHRDPKYWGPNAEHFDPDRFLPERFNLAHPCSFIPFSYGARNCIGYKYGMMSVKIALATILRRFRVVEDKETGPIHLFKVKYDITMKAVDDYEIILEKRK